MSAANTSVDMRQKITDILKENQTIPGLESFTSKPDEVTIEEDPLFLDGCSSVIVRLRAGDGSTVIAKHAPPYARAFGEAIPLLEKRAELEMTGLQLFEKYVPGLSPKPVFFSSKHNTTLMEDLSGYKMLLSELITGNVSKGAIESLAVQMAKLHRSTHKDNISAEEWMKLEKLLHKFQPVGENLAQALTSYPYFKDPQDEVAKQLKQIAESRVFKNSKLNQFLEQIVVELVHEKECLVHGDPHTKNILIKGDDGKLIDHEFVRLGRCSFDIGLMFGDMIFTYFYHLTLTEDADRHRQIAHRIRDYTYHLVNTYTQHMSWSSGEKAVHVAKLLNDMAGFTGCVILIGLSMGGRTFLGASQIPLLEAAIRLIEQHQVDVVDSIDKIYSILALE